MSVAEALGQELRTPNQETKRQQRYFPGLSLENLGTSDYGETNLFVNDPRIAKPRIDDSKGGMLYGERDYDRGYPHPRPMGDPFHHERPDMEVNKIRKQRMDMDEDIQRMKERQMKDRMEREEEKKKNYDMLTKTFPWDQKSYGHGGPRGSGGNRRKKFLETDFSPRHQEGFKDISAKPEYQISMKRETDLFLDTLGGPGGTVLRQNGSPSLTDPRFQQQQQQFQAFQNTSPRPGVMTPKEMQEYSQKLDQVSEEKKIMKQQQRIEDLRKQIDYMKNEPGMENGMDRYRSPDMGQPNEPRRSLDLENTRGGAGAPVKDFRGKNVTRRPITLSRDDYGESKIREDIPGKATFDLNFVEEDNKPYYPWGGQGGGAPIRDREGRVVTQIYGKLEGKAGPEGEVRRNKRRQEVLYNELKEGVRQQKENKEQITRYMKAPQAELADVLLAGRVGKPKRDEITGEIGQQHLPNSDVSLVKMNYQPKPVTEKKRYHDELVRMAEERQHQKELEKLKERQESNAHFQNMDSTWGAFGGGAPKHNLIRKKANLTNSLFYPDASPGAEQVIGDDYQPPTGLGSFEYQSPTMGYQKLYAEDDFRQYGSPDNSPRFVKSTINSSHKNMFEGQAERRLTRPAGAPALAPYATGGMY